MAPPISHKREGDTKGNKVFPRGGEGVAMSDWDTFPARKGESPSQGGRGKKEAVNEEKFPPLMSDCNLLFDLIDRFTG